MLIVTKDVKDDYKKGNALAGGRAKGDVLKLVNLQIAKYGATNIPTGGDVGPVMVDNLGEKTEKVVKRALGLHTSLAVGQCLITLHGETHTVTPMRGAPQPYLDDEERGNAIISTFVQSGASPRLTLFERGLGGKYNTRGFTGSTVREEDIIGSELQARERSNFVAGFLFVCLACGDQSTIDDVLIFFGAAHNDILEAFEYFVHHSDAPWMKKRGRSYAFIRSQKH